MKAEMTEQEFYNEIMHEAMLEEQRYSDNCKRINDRIFRAITNQIGAGFLNDLKTLIEESEIGGAYRIVDEVPNNYHNKKELFQEESDYGCITGIWVYQHSVGDGGDSFAGQIWVKLKNYKYLEMDFAC